MASEAHLHAWEQRLRDWEAELEARERQFQERKAILQDDGATLQDALSTLEEAEAAGDSEHLETTLQDALSSLEEAEAAVVAALERLQVTHLTMRVHKVETVVLDFLKYQFHRLHQVHTHNPTH